MSPVVALSVQCPRDNELVHCESITALPEDRMWEGNERLDFQTAIDWLSGRHHARYRSLAPKSSGCNTGCDEVEEARRMQSTTAIRSVGDVSGSCSGPMTSCRGIVGELKLAPWMKF